MPQPSWDIAVAFEQFGLQRKGLPRSQKKRGIFFEPSSFEIKHTARFDALKKRETSYFSPYGAVW